ncbi:MAG: hypothetical protein IPL47_15925 [Phyllobacteriaceae bacterium]|nr:hypothetical protein [Phyllobacteriaceae bacterium]
MRRILALLASLLLAVTPAMADYVDSGGQLHVNQPRACRDNPAEPYPPWVIKLVEPVAEPFGRAAAHVVWRHGRIGRRSDAMALLARTLRPLDIVLTKSNGRLTGHLIPGQFAHAVVYLGGEKDLKALGVWSDPAVKPHHAAIRAGRVYVEALSSRDKLSPLNKAIDADQLVVLRTGLGKTARARAARGYFAHLGVPYDFHMDAGESEALFCAELVDHVMALGLPRREQYGRTTIVPAEIAAAALAGKGGLSFVLYLKADRDGWLKGDRAMLKRDIEAGW